MIDNKCNGSSYVTSSDTFSSDTRICIIVAMAICVAVIYAGRDRHSTVHPARCAASLWPRTDTSPPTSGRHILTGWKSLRKKLI